MQANLEECVQGSLTETFIYLLCVHVPMCKSQKVACRSRLPLSVTWIP